MRLPFHRIVRILCGLLLSAIFLASLGRPAAAQAQAIIYTQPSPINLVVGQTANISIWVEDAANVYSYYVRLYFDPRVLQILDADANLPGIQVQDGDFFYRPQSVTTSNWVDNSSGVVTYINQLNDPSMSISGSGKLIAFELQVIAAGSGVSTISLSQSYLMSPQGDLLPVSVLNPQVYISATAIPVTTSTSTSTANLTQVATSSFLATATATGTLPPGVAPVEPTAAGMSGIYLPLVAKELNSSEEGATVGQTATLTRAALTHSPAPPSGSLPSVTPLAPAVISAPATPPAALFEGIGPVAWGAVILALVWLLVLVGYLVYRFGVKRPRTEDGGRPTADR